MSGFDDRERAFENKFEFDEEIEFKINSRMARLFGLWAAEQLGLSGQAATAYADAGVEVETAKSGRKDLIAKTEKDFTEKGLVMSYHRLEREMETFYRKAREQVASGKSA